MSGPQGPDPTQPWGGQNHDPSQQGGDAGQNPWAQSHNPDQPTTAAPAWGQQPPPAYTQQAPQYPQYPGADQPYSSAAPTSYTPTPSYPSTDQYSQGNPYGTQYPQQPGQYGQPGQPGQPGQYGDNQYNPYGAQPPKKGSGKTILFVVGVLAIVIIAVVGVTGFWKPGFFVTTKLDITKAQEGVQSILEDETNGYGAKNVSDVTCNDGANPEVKKDDTFTCEVTIDGTHREVTVTFLNDDGTYEVGRPK